MDNIGLQEDLDILKEWTDDWQIKFNSFKCKVLYQGKKNPKYEYRIDDIIVEESKVEKDLGIYISNDVNWNHYKQKKTWRLNPNVLVSKKY